VWLWVVPCVLPGVPADAVLNCVSSSELAGRLCDADCVGLHTYSLKRVGVTLGRVWATPEVELTFKRCCCAQMGACFGRPPTMGGMGGPMGGMDGGMGGFGLGGRPQYGQQGYGQPGYGRPGAALALPVAWKAPA